MQQEYPNVTAVVPANVYFDGKVTSRTLKFADGTTKTLGLMQPGEYEFGTEKPELMEIVAGRVKVRLAGESDWTEYAAGATFNVPGDSKFEITAVELTDYVCSFLES